MKMSASRWAWVIAAAFTAIAIPAWLLWPPQEQPPAGGMTAARLKPAGDPSSIDGRQLFSAETPGENATLPEGAPQLAGIVGRPPHDAVVLVRVDGGGTKTLAPGQSHQGWRLDAVSGEAALFSRNSRQIRVPLPAADPIKPSEQPANAEPQ